MTMLDYLAAIDQEAVQIAKETDEGEAATTGFLICPSLKFEPKRESRFDAFKRSGSRHTSSSRKNTEHTTLQVSGGADYNEIGLVLAGALRTPTSAAEAGSLVAFKHTGNVLATAPNPRNSYTAQWGSTGGYIRQATGVRFDSFGLKGARTGSLELSGTAFATGLEDSYRHAIALAVGAEAIPQMPFSGEEIGFYLSDTAAGLAGASLLADAFGGEVMLSAIAAAVWSYNRARSHSGSVEQKEQAGTAKLFLPVRNTYFDIYDELETGATYYLRMQSLGPIIEAAIRYKLTFDLAVKINTAAEEKTEQNVLALEIPFVWADDPDWGKSMQYELINTVESY